MDTYREDDKKWCYFTNCLVAGLFVVILVKKREKREGYLNMNT